MQTTPIDTLLTPRQVAEALHFTTPRPVYRMIRGGELPASRIGGRLLIGAADVDALLVESRTPRRPTGGLRELERSTARMGATDKARARR
jgi:excisionase family DNA binding protein